MKTHAGERRSVIGLIGVFALMCSALAQGEEIWSGRTKITHLYPTPSSYIFKTSYSNTSLSSCDNGTRWYISKSYENYDAMVATLLMAFAAGYDIDMNIEVAPSLIVAMAPVAMRRASSGFEMRKYAAASLRL